MESFKFKNAKKTKEAGKLKEPLLKGNMNVLSYKVANPNDRDKFKDSFIDGTPFALTHTETLFFREDDMKKAEEVISSEPGYVSRVGYNTHWPNSQEWCCDWKEVRDERGKLEMVVDDEGDEWKVVRSLNRGEGSVLIRKETDKISSIYWYTDEGVYRLANHWDRVGTCQWGMKELWSGEESRLLWKSKMETPRGAPDKKTEKEKRIGKWYDESKERENKFKEILKKKDMELEGDDWVLAFSSWKTFRKNEPNIVVEDEYGNEIYWESLRVVDDNLFNVSEGEIKSVIKEAFLASNMEYKPMYYNLIMKKEDLVYTFAIGRDRNGKKNVVEDVLIRKDLHGDMVNGEVRIEKDE